MIMVEDWQPTVTVNKYNNRKFCRFRLKSVHFQATWLTIEPKSWDQYAAGPWVSKAGSRGPHGNYRKLRIKRDSWSNQESYGKKISNKAHYQQIWMRYNNLHSRGVSGSGSNQSLLLLKIIIKRYRHSDKHVITFTLQLYHILLITLC